MIGQIVFFPWNKPQMILNKRKRQVFHSFGKLIFVEKFRFRKSKIIVLKKMLLRNFFQLFAIRTLHATFLDILKYVRKLIFSCFPISARGNVENFIIWCRDQIGIPQCLLFEVDDLVLRKNCRNFVLCLLEVSRKGRKFGMRIPGLLALDASVEREEKELDRLDR